MKISVIVPVYNVEDYLRECLNSILNQTYTNLEILLINDGSTDSSGSICDEYAEKDSRIRVIHKKNEGLSAARNVGLDRMTGDLLTFVDSDDGIHEDFLKDCLCHLEAQKADMVIGHFFQWSEIDQSFYYYIPKDSWGTIEILDSQEALNRQIDWQGLNTAPFVIACGKVFKKELFDTIRFPAGKVYEDEYTIHKLLLKANRIVLINIDYYMYRRHGKSIMTGDYSPRKDMNLIEALEERILDFVLAGRDTDLVKHKLTALLYQTKQKFEAHHCQHLPEYKRILQKIELSNHD